MSRRDSQDKLLQPAAQDKIVSGQDQPHSSKYQGQDSPPNDQPTSSPEQDSDRPRSPAEWVSLAVSSLLLVGVIAAVGYLWASGRQRQPPILAVTPAAVRSSENQYYVPFSVTNSGGETAESVQVVAELRLNGTTIESGEQIFEFLSSQEQAEGAFIFTHNPQRGTLVIRVASYQQP